MKENTLLRVIHTMTCRVGVVRWGLLSTFIPHEELSVIGLHNWHCLHTFAIRSLALTLIWNIQETCAAAIASRKTFHEARCGFVSVVHGKAPQEKSWKFAPKSIPGSARWLKMGMSWETPNQPISIHVNQHRTPRSLGNKRQKPLMLNSKNYTTQKMQRNISNWTWCSKCADVRSC